MYRCQYCNIVLRKGTEKMFKEHESGYRHKMNKQLIFKKEYMLWLEVINVLEI